MLNVVIEGCGHGALDDIYESCKALERHAGKPIDLLICCGDYQAVRNLDDLQCMAVPDKYKELGSFWEYYSGRKTAPYPTLFIGGNHEAINYLRELYYGGWAAPNIYFLGYSGVVEFGGIRIGGVSGIYKSMDYLKPHFELPPYSPSSIKSSYHVRATEIVKLSALEGGKLDVFLSHDWPCGIEKHGDVVGLLRRKKHFREDIAGNRLGSPPSMQLLRALKPSHWFSAHLHCGFAAVVEHDDHGEGGRSTKFLGLDKCLPGRHFLQWVEFPDANGFKAFSYDAEWLAILMRAPVPPSVADAGAPCVPTPPITRPTVEDIEQVRARFNNDLTIPDNFTITAPPHDPESASVTSGRSPTGKMPSALLENPQTVEFMRRLGIGDYAPVPEAVANPEALDVGGLTSSEDG